MCLYVTATYLCFSCVYDHVFAAPLTRPVTLFFSDISQFSDLLFGCNVWIIPSNEILQSSFWLIVDMLKHYSFGISWGEGLV